MPLTNKWLCVYAIAQLGRPYWWGTKGQYASNEVYADYVAPATYYADYTADLGKKVHDCSGLQVQSLYITEPHLSLITTALKLLIQCQTSHIPQVL